MGNSTSKRYSFPGGLPDAFRGEAERLGLKSEEDVAAMVKEVRRERARARND